MMRASAHAKAPAGKARQFRWPRHARKSVMVAMVLLATIVAASAVTLPLSARWYNVQDLSGGIRRPPAWTPAVSAAPYLRAEVYGGGGMTSPFDRAAFRLVSLLGHDDLGRSLLYRLLPGLLMSLAVGLAAALIAVAVGVTWGAIAGLAGGHIDAAMMRVVDVLYGLPYILLVILLKIGLTKPLTAILGDHTHYAEVLILFIAIGGVSWMTMARVVRGQVLSLRTRAFVDAARIAGAGPWHILRRHILPNLIGPVAVYGLLVVPQAVLQESFLSFLGIGIPQPVPSLGRLAADGVEAVNTFVGFWWLLLFPCLALVVVLLSLNVIGDWLRDVIDPKSTSVAMLS